jgi:nucleoside phosphorylase
VTISNETPKVTGVPLVEQMAVLRRDVEVLVVTATPTEKSAVLARMTPLPSNAAILKGAIGAATYYVGRLGAHGIALTMGRMGAVGGGSSKDAVAGGCEVWEPRAVIMVGIAFGKDAAKQGIGDVLVASQIISYAERRVGPKIEYRGPIAEASRGLVDRFRNVDDWTFGPRADGSMCEMRVGALLSGEELIDEAGRKAELFEAFPQAIGGEMEGRGLYAAAQEAGVAWILVKAICDWGDGTKHKKDQPFAAQSAADLVYRVLAVADGLEGVPAKKARKVRAPTAKVQTESAGRVVTASGRGVAVGGDMKASIVITSDDNVVKRGSHK